MFSVKLTIPIYKEKPSGGIQSPEDLAASDIADIHDINIHNVEDVLGTELVHVDEVLGEDVLGTEHNNLVEGYELEEPSELLRQETESADEQFEIGDTKET